MEKNSIALLTEGSNHIKHLYDNPELTFGKIKEILVAAANGQLEGTEKVDGIRMLISYSVNKNHAVGARNKEDIKNSGRTAKELYKDFEEHEKNNLKNVFFDAITSFEKMVQGLDINTQIDLFGEDADIFYLSDIVCPTLDDNGDPLNVINYDTRNIIIHEKGHNEYNKQTGEPTGTDISNKISKLNDIIKSFQENIKHENYGVQINAIKRLNALSNKIPLNSAINRINSVVNSVNSSISNPQLKLNDSSTINNFMIARIYIILNSILKKAPEDFGTISLNTKINLAKKIFGVSGISTIDLRRKLSREQFLFIKEKILDNKKIILKTSIHPIEVIITDFTIEMLKSLQSAYVVDDRREVRRLREKVKQAINQIQKYGNNKDLVNLKRQVQKLKNVDRVTTSAEGFVFDYDGVTYKFTGSFAPVNQIIHLFKKVKKEANNKIPQQVAEEKHIDNKIVLLAGSFKPPHKGHLDMVKSFLQNEKPNKIIIYISRMDRNGFDASTSLNIWKKYLHQANISEDIVTPMISDSATPVTSVLDYASQNCNDGDVVVIGYSNKNDEQQIKAEDIDLTKLNKKIKIKIVPYKPKYENMNSSDMRKAINKNDKNKLVEYIPDEYGTDKKAIIDEIINLCNRLSENVLSDIINNILDEHIVKRGKKYCLLSKKSNRNLGCYTSRKAAARRERQVQYFKHMKK